MIWKVYYIISKQENNKEKQRKRHIKTGGIPIARCPAISTLSRGGHRWEVLQKPFPRYQGVLKPLLQEVIPAGTEQEFHHFHVLPIGLPLRDNEIGAGDSLRLMTSSCLAGTVQAYQVLLVDLASTQW